MKIKMINENKLQIMFDYTELEENNISVHSFLSNPIDKQTFFLAILDIANEDLGFNLHSGNFSYETISFDNKFFTVFVTKQKNNFNLLELCENSKNQSQYLLYKFSNMNEVFEFCKIINKQFKYIKIPSKLIKYNETLFIKLNLENLSPIIQEKLNLFISEFKNKLKLTPLALKKLEEFSETLINTNALKKLSS